MENALIVLSNWTRKCGLDVNPAKTEMVLFSRNHQTPQISPPKLQGTPLTFSDQAKYLGVTLDRKLSWKPNLMDRVKKATVALYSCKRAVGKNWGINPKIMRWLYTAVIRPILLYGVVVWWPALNKASYTKMLNSVQRMACISITGAMRTSPTAALETILHLTPVDICSKELAAKSALRLKALSQWRAQRTGHASILIPYQFTEEPTDYSAPILDFEIKYKTRIPSRQLWETNSVLNDGIAKEIYTDGSKTGSGVGAGIYSEHLQISRSFRLPDYCSVFQAEITAIREAAEWLLMRTISNVNIVIYTDSQAAIMALESPFLRSKLVRLCRMSLNEISRQCSLTVCWVPGHSDIPGNCEADELARNGTTITGPKIEYIGVPIETQKTKFTEIAISNASERWYNINTCLHTKQVWPKMDLKRTSAILSLSRKNLSNLVGVLTGHCAMGRHAARLGLPYNDFCSRCMDEEEEENPSHLLCNCPAFASIRKQTLGEYYFNELTDISEKNVKSIWTFVQRAKWFQE